MTYGTGLQGLHALCIGAFNLRKPICLGESDFVTKKFNNRAPTHFQHVAARVVITQSAVHTLNTSPIMSTLLLG